MAYVRVQTSDTTLNRIQSSIGTAIDAVGTTGVYNLSVSTTTGTTSQIQSAVLGTSLNMLGGSLLEMVVLTAGPDNLIPHKLQRVPNFYFVMPPNVQSTIWSPVTAALATSQGVAQASDSNYLNLWCSTSCTVLVWVN